MVDHSLTSKGRYLSLVRVGYPSQREVASQLYMKNGRLIERDGHTSVRRNCFSHIQEL
jgi:hypothetical protein